MIYFDLYFNCFCLEVIFICFWHDSSTEEQFFKNFAIFFDEQIQKIF